jgi:hypothetical protein
MKTLNEKQQVQGVIKINNYPPMTVKIEPPLDLSASRRMRIDIRATTVGKLSDDDRELLASQLENFAKHLRGRRGLGKVIVSAAANPLDLSEVYALLASDGTNILAKHTAVVEGARK